MYVYFACLFSEIAELLEPETVGNVSPTVSIFV